MSSVAPVWRCARLLRDAGLAADVVGGAQADTELEELVEEQAAGTDVAWEDSPYEVVDGKVDFGTDNGYRRYHRHWHVCHGPDGPGSSYAPALIESLPRIGYEGYLGAVISGIEKVSQNQQAVMPAFGEVEDVVNYIDDIYSCLKARADGVIGRGRPQRLP